MRSVWTQTARPRLPCNGVSRSESLPSILARRTASTPPRARLTVQDAFTILLGPVLATAFVVDTSWKDKRRRDWDDKIAQIVAEVEALRVREQQAWAAHQYRSVRLGSVHQRRHYATAAYALIEDNGEDVPIPTWDDLNDQEDVLNRREKESSPDCGSLQEEADAVRSLRQLQRLVAVKMAIQLILHVHQGSSPRFADLHPSNLGDPNPPADVTALMKKLREVRYGLKNIEKSRAKVRIASASLISVSPSDAQRHLDQYLHRLSQEYAKGAIGVRAYIEKLSHHILQSSASPSSKGYLSILRVLSRSEYHDMCTRVIAAIQWDAPLQLDAETVYHILWQFGKTKDTYSFDRLLQRLTTVDSSVGSDRRWEWWRINGTPVPVPVSKDLRLLQVLVYTSLHCDQPGKAEAWASFFNEKRHSGNYSSYVANNFLRYYSVKADWKHGMAWMRNVQAWATELWKSSEKDLQRVIFAMLDLCVSCGQRELYAKIIDAAASTGIGVYPVDFARNLSFAPRSKAILREWEELHDKYLSKSADSTTVVDPAREFQRRLQDALQEISPQENNTVSSRSISGAASSEETLAAATTQNTDAKITELKRQWQEMRIAQNAELQTLQAELGRLRAAYTSLSAAAEMGVLNPARNFHETMREELRTMRADLDRSTQNLHTSQSVESELKALRAELNRSRQQLLPQQQIQEELIAVRAELQKFRSHRTMHQTATPTPGTDLIDAEMAQREDGQAPMQEQQQQQQQSPLHEPTNAVVEQQQQEHTQDQTDPSEYDSIGMPDSSSNSTESSANDFRIKSSTATTDSLPISAPFSTPLRPKNGFRMAWYGNRFSKIYEDSGSSGSKSTVPAVESDNVFRKTYNSVA